MLEARIRKNYPCLVKEYFPETDDLSISIDHATQCSVYNQGCDGGYSYLTLKFLNEFEMIFDKCYSKENGCMKKCKDPKLDNFQLSLRDYKYVGGSYGKCSEEAIIKEVYENGPIVVSFEPDESFNIYKSGIFHQLEYQEKPDRVKKPEWEKVDHAVVLLGWGEEKINNETIKYWILQNSWGSSWGENGYMKIIRGSDHMGIESKCESALPILTKLK
jgi:cathepsin C